MKNIRRNSAFGGLLLAVMLGVAVVHADLMVEVGRLLYPSTLARNGVATFDASNGFLQVNGSPYRTHFPTSVRNHLADPAGTLQISVLVLDPSGATASGAGSPAFQMQGAFDVDGNGTVEPGETGVMLTGDFVELGHRNALAGGSVLDGLGFRFKVTGGFLAPLYAGRNIGVDAPMTSSTGFPEPATPNQDFGQSFNVGLNTITVKPIDCAVQIGEFVWHDTDGDGVQEPGEPGLNGVRVWLKSLDDTILATAVTGRGPFNQGGYYLFERMAGFCAGTYKIEVDASTLPAGFSPSPINAPGSDATTDSQASPATVTLDTDVATNHTIDFGYTTFFNGKVGGTVWHDVNGNGLQEAGEPGIEGVRINVYDGANALAGTTTSVANGYDISGLSPGSFRVEVDATTLPAGFAPTIPFAGPPEIDSDGSPAFITLGALTPTARDIGFGYVGTCVGTIGDLVWYDRNQNGTQDAGEPGLASIRVGLVKADGTPVATTSTNTDGRYSFGALCAGSYRVVIDPADLPAGFTPTIVQHKPAGVTLDSNGSPADVVLATDSSTDDTIDLGYIAACSGKIGDRVWRDQNRNGLQDEGETGFAGVTINLRRRSDNTIIQSDTTDAAGAYRFDGLCPGDYIIEMAPPDGATVSPTLKGDPTLDSDLNPTKIRLLFDDSSDLTVDFGLFADGGIGDRVWRDDDGDGVQDSDEPSLGGVTLTLTDAQGRVTTTTTDTNGQYYFPIGAAGTYTVSVTPPAGFGGVTQAGAGGDPAADSNPNPATVVLARADSSDFTIDFGILKEVTTPPTPGLKVVKTANKNTAVFGEAVTFTYVVTNTGTMTLTNVVAVDDNATPGYRYDDFTVGTVASLAPGATATFTATRVPPMKMCNDDGGWNRKCGMMIVQHFAQWTKFIYLQAKDHRDDYRDGSGWWGGRSYSHKAKFRIGDRNGLVEQNVEGAIGDGDDDDEYVNSFSVNVEKSFASGPDGSVSVPRIYHKKGWNSNWNDDWDRRHNDYSRSRWWDEHKWGHNNDDDYDHDKHPKQCPTTSTNIVKVTAKAGTIAVTATDKETVQVVAPAPVAPFKTFTIGGWGAKPSGNNPGKFLATNFGTVYPGGSVTVGGTKTLKLTSASAIEKFLPQTGSPSKLTQSYVNPTWNVSSFAGQVLALKLNVDFSAAGLTRQGLGALTLVSGELRGKSVTEVLALANTVLGGGSLPYGLSLSELHDIVSKINENFDGGTQNNGFLR
jgi:hypothetical protein